MALLSETFDGPDSVFASSSAFWDNSDLGVSENPDWFAESGTMSRLSGTGRTTSSVFRMWTRRTDLAFTTVEMAIRFNGWTGGTAGWHGINLWLNRRLRTPSDGSRINDGPQQEGYVVDFLNRDGSLLIMKKVGDVYYTLSKKTWTPVTGTWYRWGGRVIDNGNGTSTIQVLVDGQVIQQATDDGSVGGPRLLGGRAGLRSDYSDMTVDNLAITGGGAGITGGGAGMTTFARDSCTDADGTLLQNHVPEVGGPWAKEGSGVDLTINTGRIVYGGDTSGTTYYLGGLAATDEFDVEARFVRLGTAPSDGQLALTFRNDTAASTFYRLRWVESNLAWQWGKTIAGALTTLGSSTAQPLNAANPARTVKVVCRNALKEFFVDGVKIGETTDNAITGFRRVGTRPFRAGTATNGFALDDLLAADLVVSDTTPPAVPTGLAATPGNAQVALSWTANAESDLAGYRLYRGGVQVYDGAAATFTDATVTNGTTYSYAVSAYDTAGNESAQSAAVQATPAAPADTTPPAVPTGLAAATGNAQVSLDWSDNTEGDLAGYRLYRGGVQIFDGVASAYLDSAINGTTYSYAVSAYDTAGNESAQSAAVQATPTFLSGIVAPHNRAVLTPRPIAQPPPDTYQAWLGPLRFVTVLGDVTETLGETIEAIGAALTAAERRPRPFKVTLPVRGDRSEADPYAAGLRLRRQVRQLIENSAWRNEPLYFWFGPDPDLQGWLLVGGGDLSYDDGGLVHSDFKLELTDCYLVGRPGQVRPARRLELADHRGGTAPRDTRRTLYSTDHAAQPLPDQPLIVPGDTVRLTGARRAPLDPLTTPGPTIAGRALWRSVPVTHGDVVDYTPDPLSLPDPVTALRDLDPPGRVRAWDVTAGIPTINSYTPTGDQDPAAGYGWAAVLGKPLRGGAVGALDNGWCRVLSDLRGGIRIERLDLTAGTYVTVATVLTQETVLDIAAVELTAERAVIAARTPNREIRAVLQRGWDGPRLEVYHDAPAFGAPTLLIVPQANYTLPAQNPTWVRAAHLDTGARLLLAPAQADTTLTQETIDEQSTIRLSQPTAAPGVLVCQVALALAGDALTAGQVASRAICDARSVPTLVTAA